MSKRTFTKEQLQLVLCGDEGEVILDQITSTGRWDVYHRLIFRPEDEVKLYETSYSKAATELQSGPRPFEYQDHVECEEVEAFEKTVVDYRSVRTSS